MWGTALHVKRGFLYSDFSFHSNVDLVPQRSRFSKKSPAYIAERFWGNSHGVHGFIRRTLFKKIKIKSICEHLCQCVCARACVWSFPDVSCSITLKCPLGRVLLLSCPHFSCMLGICESPLLREKKCWLFFLNHNTDNALAQCVYATHSEKPWGVKLASVFLYGPAVHRHYICIPS